MVCCKRRFVRDEPVTDYCYHITCSTSQLLMFELLIVLLVQIMMVDKLVTLTFLSVTPLTQYLICDSLYPAGWHIVCLLPFCLLCCCLDGKIRLVGNWSQTMCELSLLNNNNNRFTALCPGLPGWASTRRNIHPPIILIIIQTLSTSSMYYVP